MNKTIKRGALLLSLVSCGLMRGVTSEFRSPLSVRKGMMHDWLMPVSETWWAQAMDTEPKERQLYLNTWSASFYRSAHESFFNGCDRNSNTTKTVSLSTLFFGKESFRGEEAFTDGILDPTTLTNSTPFLGFARITPRFDYNECGTVFGVHAEYRLGHNDKWRVGGRASLPFHVIEIEQNSNCQLEETLDDVVTFRNANLDAGGPNQIEFAARLDFLSSLIINPGPAVINGVRYGNGQAGGINATEIVGVTVSAPTNNGEAGPNGFPPVYLINRADGTLPAVPYRKSAAQANPGALPANGQGSNNSVFFFKDDVNYTGAGNLATNRDAQGELFVVPRRRDAADTFFDNTLVIEDRIRNLVALLKVGGAETATEFFRDRGIDLNAHYRRAALGDIDLEWYFGYGPMYWFTNLVLGLRLPSGTKEDSASQLFFQSTGHKRHVEFMVRAEGGWQPYEWFGFRLDGSWHHAFGRSEKRAAPFKGATIKNIGPEIKADVSWNYFVVHADFDFFHPRNPDLGAVIGYELFAKLDDNVDLCDKTATDLLGRQRELDGTILENNTNSMTHKFRGEVFHRWNYGEIFVGASHIVAGRNAMQETEAHLGLAMHF